MKPLKRIAFFAALLGLFFALPAVADDVSNGSYSTTDASNNASPPNGWPAGMFPNQVEPTARSNMGATKRFWERSNPTLSTTGSAGAYIITPTNVSYPTAYTQGEVICAKANFTSVGNDTLNVNSLGAKAIYSVVSGAIARVSAGQILSGQEFCAAYDGALNSGAGGFQLLSDSTFAVNGSGSGPALNFSGYAPLPGGLIVQFGYVLAPGASGTTVTLPIAFPHALIGSDANVQMSGSTGNLANTYPIDSQHIGISTTVTGAFQVFWMAFGY